VLTKTSTRPALRHAFCKKSKSRATAQAGDVNVMLYEEIM